MVLVLILGGGFGWFAHRARVQREAVAAIEKAGGLVSYDFNQPKSPAWRKRLANAIGIDYVESVKAVFLGQYRRAKADDALLAEIGHLSHLEYLELTNQPSVTDAGLVHLRGLTQLKNLDLGGTGIRGPVLPHLKGLGRLEQLDLRGLQTSDADLVHLKGLPNLEDLTLSGRQITDQGLGHLAALAHLNDLNLLDTSIGSLEPLLPLANTLEGLGLEGQIDDFDLATLERFRWLSRLGFGKTQRITDAGLSHINSLTGLTYLQLSGTGITNAGLSHISTLTKLELLDLRDTGITDAGLTQLGGLTSLRHLELSNTSITDAGLPRLTGLAKCRFLSLRDTKVSQAGINALKTTWPLLRIWR